MKNKILAIGIDQGIANCGISLVSIEDDHITILHEETLRTPSDLPTEKRLLSLYESFNRVYEKSVEYGSPAVVIGCEKLLFNKPRKTDRQVRNKSASMMLVNMVTGVIALFAGQHNLTLYQFVPGTIKKYVAGHGRAKKEEVDAVLQHLLPPDKRFSSDHASDSAGIGITAVRKYMEEHLSS